MLDRNYFEHNGIKYFVDGKNVVLDYSKNEKGAALWLNKTFGGTVYMLPRINKPDGIKTADYLWNGEYWDLKEIIGISSRAIDNALKRKKSQSENFIIDISKNILDKNLLIQQAKKIYKTSGRDWINKIIIKDNNKILVFKKK